MAIYVTLRPCDSLGSSCVPSRARARQFGLRWHRVHAHGQYQISGCCLPCARMENNTASHLVGYCFNVTKRLSPTFWMCGLQRKRHHSPSDDDDVKHRRQECDRSSSPSDSGSNKHSHHHHHHKHHHHHRHRENGTHHSSHHDNDSAR